MGFLRYQGNLLWCDELFFPAQNILQKLEIHYRNFKYMTVGNGIHVLWSAESLHKDNSYSGHTIEEIKEEINLTAECSV